MRLIKPRVKYLPQLDLYKHIELCGRTCYKSEDKITPESSEKFIERMIKSRHLSVLEHGTVYLSVGNELDRETQVHMILKYKDNPYSKVVRKDGVSYITTNYRVIIENNWLDDLKYVTPPIAHERRYTFKIVTNRGVTHELVRHRHFSFSQESTRYCNYSRDKFNNELTFIIPHNLTLPEGSYYRQEGNWCINRETSTEGIDMSSDELNIFLFSIFDVEHDYMDLINTYNWTAQDARGILPIWIKSEICMTGFETDWVDFLNKRYFGTTGAPHPDMLDISSSIMGICEQEHLLNFQNHD